MASCSRGSKGRPIDFDRGDSFALQQRPQLAVQQDDALDPADVAAAPPAWRPGPGRNRRRRPAPCAAATRRPARARARDPRRFVGGSWRSRRPSAAEWPGARPPGPAQPPARRAAGRSRRSALGSAAPAHGRGRTAGPIAGGAPVVDSRRRVDQAYRCSTSSFIRSETKPDRGDRLRSTACGWAPGRRPRRRPGRHAVRRQDQRDVLHLLGPVLVADEDLDAAGPGHGSPRASPGRPRFSRAAKTCRTLSLRSNSGRGHDVEQAVAEEIVDGVAVELAHRPHQAARPTRGSRSISSVTSVAGRDVGQRGLDLVGGAVDRDHVQQAGDAIQAAPGRRVRQVAQTSA